MPADMTPAVRRLTATAALALACLALAGCGAGDVELNGKVFSAIGALTGSNATDQEVKIAPRPGIVQPPSLQNLPPPGSEKAPDGQLAEIHDADTVKTTDKSALMAQQAAYCKEHYDVPKSHGDDVTADAAVGPMGPCRKSALSLLGDSNPLDWLNKK